MNSISKIMAALRRRKTERYRRDLWRRAEGEIQLHEEAGRVYLAYQGIPLVEVGNLSLDPVKAVHGARNAFVGHYLRRREDEERQGGYGN